MSTWVTEGKRMIYERGVASGEKGRKGGTMLCGCWISLFVSKPPSPFLLRPESDKAFKYLTEVIMLTDRQSHLMSAGLQLSAEKTFINVSHLLLGNYRDEIG